MPDSQTGPSGSKPAKRSLPSWRQNESSKKLAGSGEHEDIGEGEKHKGTKNAVSKGTGKSESNRSSTNFSKLLEGVVFVLSGFVNPERGILRSQALEMGADYQPDWNADCTLLVCAFQNTPKFRQVVADNGTIVSKDWISECYSQKKLVDIDVYLMHAGKPWRRSNLSDMVSQEQETSPSKNSMKKVEKGSHSKNPTSSGSSKTIHSGRPEDLPSPSKVKHWAMIDLGKTISWLESQDEKPEADEIKKIAAEGILTCLQDAIDALEQKKGVQGMSEQWNILPQAVEELIKLDGSENPQSSVALRKSLCKWASECKQMYEAEYRRSSEGDASKTESKGEKTKAKYYDSDETIEMTEEEIDVAFNRVASNIC